MCAAIVVDDEVVVGFARDFLTDVLLMRLRLRDEAGREVLSVVANELVAGVDMGISNSLRSA